MRLFCRSFASEAFTGIHLLLWAKIVVSQIEDPRVHSTTSHDLHIAKSEIKKHTTAGIR